MIELTEEQRQQLENGKAVENGWDEPGMDAYDRYGADRAIGWYLTESIVQCPCVEGLCKDIY